MDSKALYAGESTRANVLDLECKRDPRLCLEPFVPAIATLEFFRDFLQITLSGQWTDDRRVAGIVLAHVGPDSERYASMS